MDYDENQDEIPDNAKRAAEEKHIPEKPVKKAAPKKENKMPGPPVSNLPVYDVSEDKDTDSADIELKEGDTVRHKKYGIGIIKKVIGYSEKKLCSIQFENVGRRLLDPRIAELEKI